MDLEFIDKEEENPLEFFENQQKMFKDENNLESKIDMNKVNFGSANDFFE